MSTAVDEPETPMSTASTPWKPTVRPPRDGEAVRESIAARAHRDNEQRTRHLKDRLDAIEAGQALVMWGQPIGEGVGLWSAVYLGPDGIWYPAIARLAETDGLTGYAPEAHVSGLVFRMGVGTADVLIHGTVPADSGLLSRLDGAYVAGPAYLSALTPGNLSVARPVFPIRIGLIWGPAADGAYRIFFNPVSADELSNHIHYHIPLVSRPAGVPNCAPEYQGPTVGDTDPEGPHPDFQHEVVDPDVSAQGWLPADSPVFSGMEVPEGAAFGYNFAAHGAAAQVFPTDPISLVDLTVNGRGVVGELVEINPFGIWWMSDRYGQAPWDPNFGPCILEGSSESEEPSLSPEAQPFPLRIDLWVTRMNFGGLPVVTDLQPDGPSVVLTNADGQDATKGELRIRLAEFEEEAETEENGPVLTGLDGPNRTVRTGAAVRRLRSLSSRIHLTGTEETGGWASGLVEIGFSDPSEGFELPVSPIALNNVQEQNVNGLLYLRFPANRVSEIRAKVAVPWFNLPQDQTVDLVIGFWFAGLGPGAFSLSDAGLSLSYRLLKLTDCDPAAIGMTDTVLTPAWQEICGDTLSPNEYVVQLATPIEVDPGDLLYVTLNRPAGANNLGLLRIAPILRLS